MAYKYCKQTTINHPKYNDKFAKPLSVAIKDEGGPNVDYHSIVVDLDAMAKSKHKDNTESTMDIFFGISNEETSKDPKICLVDFKYRVDGKFNSSLSDCQKKVGGSISILGRDISFYNKYYFVFSDKEQVARRILNSKKFNNPNDPLQFINTDTLLKLFW